MADTTTELEVLDQIVDVLGGTSGQYETVVPTLQQILALLGGGGGGGGGGYNPSLSVGRADALTGADDTAQWATRESTGSGAATVRSVQGAAEVIDGALVPVQIAGIRSTTAQGGELDAIEWTAQTLWGAGAAGDMLYADRIERHMGVVDLGALRWLAGNTNVSGSYEMLSDTLRPVVKIPATSNLVANIRCLNYETRSGTDVYLNNKGIAILANGNVAVFDPDYNQQDSPAAFKAAMSGILLYYELATPTTTPISPALPMTYKVQAGGSEAIIVPSGEISAPPILTVAEGESAATLVMDALACIATPDGPVATANHAINTYLTYNGKLWKVTSAIAVGETITPNTNVTETTVMAELIARTA